ncbi:TonB family protein [Pontibacter indicus]|uniref:TonB family C-terminal domain-containing protein n=1 Tax=Pontibacter indicus TaxID=1317125 RepID=A0A1R3XPA6_9BACT|nr:TonB family protein [Pontibacter indicus]SIT93766.1 TonB family C-terminal domain-containing protein [Pontibacter indicus]
MKNKNTRKIWLAAPLLALLLSFGLQTDVLAQSKKSGKEPYAYVEQMPEFKGGEKEMMKFLGTNIQYPAIAKSNGLEGLAVLTFVVEADGKISDVKTVKSLSKETDEEAIRVVNMLSGQWNPGRQNGEVVRVRYTLPIRFALKESDRAATASVANRMPAFKGGTEAMHQAMMAHLSLPAEAKKENLNARVMVKFYVDREGQVSNVRLEGTKLKKMVGPGSELDYMDASTFQLQNKALLAKLSESAMSAVKATSGQWEPALKSGQPAGAEVVLPVQFLSSESGQGSEKMGVPTMTKYTKASYKIDEVDVKPTFKEGAFERYLAKNLRYPADASFEGLVDVHLVVKEDGKVMSMFTVAIGKELHDAITGTIRNTQGMWNPGKVDGQPVPVSQTIKVLFVIEGSANKPSAEDLKNADVVVTRYK